MGLWDCFIFYPFVLVCNFNLFETATNNLETLNGTEWKSPATKY